MRSTIFLPRDELNGRTDDAPDHETDEREREGKTPARERKKAGRQAGMAAE